MPVHCAQCGEELLGAVNRCWRCGAALVPQAGPIGVPPVRRAPIETPLDAAVIEDEASAAGGDTAAEDCPPAEDRQFAEARPSAQRRAPAEDRGTTQAPRHEDPQQANVRVDAAHSSAAPRPAPPTGTVATGTPASRAVSSAASSYRAQTAAVGGAVGAVALGALGIVGALLFPPGGVITALLGLAMGLWGLFSRRRMLALSGILLCLIALSIGAILGGLQFYLATYGHLPWQPAPEPGAWDEGF